MVVRLIENPFSRDTKTLAFADLGQTLQDLVDSIDISETLKKDLIIQKVSESLEDYETINPDDYPKIYLKEEDNYLVMVKLRGGSGGKSILRMVMMVAVVAFAAFAAPIVGAWAGGAAVSGGIGAGGTAVGGSAMFFGGASVIATSASALAYAGIVGAGMMLMDAIVPLPGVNVGDASYESQRSLTNSSNQMSMYYPIPRIYGKTMFSPYKVAPDYTETVGDDMYLRSLFCFGYGPLKISDIKIGTNSIENYSEVEYEIREGWQDDEPIGLYTGGIKSQIYNSKLHNEPATIVTTLENQEECSIDINFPYGMVETAVNSKNQSPATTYVKLRYREHGTENWIDFNTFTYSYLILKPFTKNIRIKFPTKGKYDVEISQYGGNHDDKEDFCAAYLTVFRNISYTYPVNIKGMALLAVRIKATDQLSGTLDNLSALCESYAFVPLSHHSQPEQGGEKYNNYIDINSVSLLGDKSTFSDIFVENPNINLKFINGISSNNNKFEKIKTSIKLEWESDENSGSKTFHFEKDNQKYGESFEEVYSIFEGESNNFSLTVTHLGDVGIYTEIVYERNSYDELVPVEYTREQLFTASSVCSPEINFIGKNEVEAPTGKKAILNRHPAWHVYDILTGTSTDEPISEDMIDIQSFLDWEIHYTNWLVDKAIDGSYTKLAVIRDMCSAGKAFFTQINGKYTIVMDRVGKSPVAAISSRNSFGFEMTKTFQKEIHGFTVSYIDPEQDWTTQEVVVYNNGYNESNATNFEGIESYGCTDRERAWKFGKYMLGQYVLRPEKYTVSQDIESVAVNTGDVVLLYSDVLKSGIGSARIKEVFYNDNGMAEGIIVDDKFYLPDNNLYNAYIRNSIGKLNSVAINHTTEETDLLEFSSPIPITMLPEIGEQIFLGIVDRENIRCIVHKKEPGADYSALISLVPEAPEIHDESTLELPPYDPNINDIPEYENKAPLKPLISNIISDERALIKAADGSYQESVSFLVQPQTQDTAKIVGIQTFIQTEDSPIVNRESFPYTGNDTVILKSVEGGKNSIIKVRYVSDKNIVSEWNELNIFIEGKTNPPPDIQNLDRQGYNIVWNYSQKPLDFEGFRVYYNYGQNTNKKQAIKAHTESLWASPPFSAEHLPKGQITIFVVAVDTSGNESLNPAIISFYNGDFEYDNIIKEIDFKAGGFQGLKENMDILDGNLVSTSDNIFYAGDNDNFYKENSSLFYSEETFKKCLYSFEVTNDIDIQNSFVKLDWDIQGDYKIYYIRESNEKFYKEIEEEFYPEEGETFYSSNVYWYPMPDKLLVGLEKVTFKIEFESSQSISSINKLKVVIDAPDNRETISNFSVSAAGSRINVSRNYKIINKVFVSIEGGSDASFSRVIDYSNSGPLIQLFDVNGNAVSGVVNVEIMGYV